MKFANCTTPDHHQKGRPKTQLLDITNAKLCPHYSNTEWAECVCVCAPRLRRYARAQVMASVKVILLAKKNRKRGRKSCRRLRRRIVRPKQLQLKDDNERWWWRQHLHWIVVSSSHSFPASPPVCPACPAVSPSNKCHCNLFFFISTFCCFFFCLLRPTGHWNWTAASSLPNYSALPYPARLPLCACALGLSLWKIKICKQLASSFQIRKYFMWMSGHILAY